MRKRKGAALLLVTLMLLLCACVLFVGGVAFLVSPFNQRGVVVSRKSASTYHAVPQDPHFETLWSSSVFMECMTCLIAAGDEVYFLGTLKNGSPLTLTSLDLLTGEIRWQTGMPQLWTFLFAHNSEYLFASMPSPNQSWKTGRVTAYDRDEGERVWIQSMPGSKGIRTGYANEEALFVIGEHYRMYRLELESGEITPVRGPGFPAWEKGLIHYLIEPDGIRAVSTKTEETIWFREVPVYPPPLFLEDVTLAGGGKRNLLGRATAIDLGTGDILWEYGKVVSNIAASGSIAFFLKLGEDGGWAREIVSDAWLVAVDVRSGDMLASLQFEPPGIQSGSGNYLYNVAASNDIVLVHLADGRQLFALRLAQQQ